MNLGVARDGSRTGRCAWPGSRSFSAPPTPPLPVSDTREKNPSPFAPEPECDLRRAVASDDDQELRRRLPSAGKASRSSRRPVGEDVRIG